MEPWEVEPTFKVPDLSVRPTFEDDDYYPLEYTKEEILNRIDDPPPCQAVVDSYPVPNGHYEIFCEEEEWDPFSGLCKAHDPNYL